MKVNQHIKNTALFHTLEQNNSDMVKTALAAGANCKC
jgi:ankyrin repeat protein